MTAKAGRATDTTDVHRAVVGLREIKATETSAAVVAAEEEMADG